MIQYKTNKTPATPKEYLEMLQEMWNDNYMWQQDKFWYSIFYKKIIWKIDREKKDAIKTKEWLEFYELYKQIKNAWLSNERLIHKYNKLVQEWKHELIMKNLKQYNIYLDVSKKWKEFALQASTYINQKRYDDKWEIVTDMSRKWLNDIYDERKLTVDEIEMLNWEIKKWEATQKQEIRRWVVENMILSFFKK